MSALTVTNAGLDLARDVLDGAATVPLAITWVAIGTGTQGTPATATQLATEVARFPLTSIALGGAHGESIFNALLGPTTGVGAVISEVGFFGGAATSAANTGTLIFYGSYSHTHTGAESIQFSADSTI